MEKTLNNSRIQFAMLRIGVALTIIAKIWMEFGQLDLLYSRNGIIQHILTDSLQQSYAFSLPNVVNLFNIKNELLFLNGIHVINFISAICLLIGFKSKLNAFLCLLIHMLIFNGYNILTFGFDGFLFILLFYAVLLPINKAFSLDNILNKELANQNSNNEAFYIKVIQIHLSIVYLAAGVSKLKGYEWIDGTAIWNAINQPQFYTNLTPFIKSVASYPTCAVLLSWATLFFETCFVGLIWINKLRINSIVLVSIIFMHMFIGAVMGLGLFAWIMIVFDLSAFGGIFIEEAIRFHRIIKNKNQPIAAFAS